MPRKPRTTRRRRAIRRKPTTVNVNRALNPLPQKYITKHKFAATVLTGANGQYTFNLNSLWGPTDDGITHQPYGFDQLAALYNRYRVYNCSYVIQVPKTDIIIQACAVPGNSIKTILGSAAYSLLKESPRARFFTQNPGGQAMRLVGNVNLPSLAGRSRKEYMADDRYQAQSAADPLEELELVVKVVNAIEQPIEGVAVNIIMEFTAEWFDVKPLTQS